MSTTVGGTRPVLAFDHHAARNSHDRDAVIGELREHEVFWSEAHGGFWVATSHAVATHILRTPEVFSSYKADDGSGGVTLPTVGPRLLPAELDPPEHTEMRRMLNAKFNKSAVEDIRPLIETVVTGAVDEVVAKRDFDVVHDIADVVPARVIVAYLGFEEEDRLPFIESVKRLMSFMSQPGQGGEEEAQTGLETFASTQSKIMGLVEARRAEPTDDLVSYLVSQTARPLTDDELLWVIFTILVGGIENLAALIANAMLFISQESDLRAKLVADPDLVDPATDEFLRFVTAGVSTVRNVTEDTELAGQRLRAGDRVVVWLPAANRDSRMFEDPDKFRLDRPNARQHVGLGQGPHFCLGRELGVVEFKILLREVLRRMPDFTVNLAGSHRADDAAIAYNWLVMPATTNL